MTVLDELAGIANGGDDGGWATSRDPGTPWPAPLSDAAHHGIAGEIVQTIAPRTEADPAALLFHLLVYCGNVFGRDAYLAIEANNHYPNLYAVIVGDTSKARKGTAEGWVRRILREAAPEWESNQTSSGLSTGEGLIERVRDTRIEKVYDKKSKTWSDEVIDGGVSDKRLLVMEYELARALAVMCRKDNTLSSILRVAWDGTRLGLMTRHNPIRATGALVSLVAHITIVELRSELTDIQAANGFGNRCLFACARRSRLLPFGGILEADVMAELTSKLGNILKFPSQGALQLDIQARGLWRDCYEALSKGGTRMFDALTARSEAQALRVAMIYALLDHQRQIGLHHLEAALEIIRYSNDSVRYIFGDATGDPTADTILRSLRNTASGLTRSDINNLFRRNTPSADIAAALAKLLEHGLAMPRRRGTGGRPAEIWFAC
jgi:hypothetical protein